MPTPLTNQLEQLRDQADSWIARLNSDLCKSQDEHEFAVWLAQSPAHRQAFDQQLDLFQQLGALDGLSLDERRQPASSGSTEAVDQPSSDEACQQPRAATELWPKWAQASSWGALACAATVLLAVFWPASPSSNRLHYSTGPGEIRSIKLSDGSMLQLNTRSAISIDFSDKLRQLTLTRGEAYFDVAKDRQRPFSVNLGDSSVTAIGTSFNIYRRGDSAQVHLTEGIISVAAAEIDSPRQISQGQSFQLSSAGIDQLQPQTHQPDWLDGNLDFDNTPLAEAIAELNRYLRQPVELQLTPAQRQLPVSGHFAAGEANATVEAIALSFNLHLNDANGRRTLETRP